MKNLINTICYKVKTPRVYCEGGKENFDFLACYGYKDTEKNKSYIDLLNTDKTIRKEFCNKHHLDFENIDYFYHHQQELFDTMGD